MLLRLILLMTLVPLAELALLVQLTILWDSLLLTIGIVLATGLFGAALARHQGLKVWRRIRDSLSAGELPADSLLDGLFILLAAALLVTPGLLTDAFGFLLLIPPTRKVARRLAKRWFLRRIQAVQTLNAEAGFVPHWDASGPRPDGDADGV